jgi:hypothetical protein
MRETIVVFTTEAISLTTYLNRNLVWPMQFRDHKLMSYKGLPTWPPVWAHPDSATLTPPTVKGEIGILTSVRMHALGSQRIFLNIKHEGSEYIGCLFFDDPVFCQDMYQFLQGCIGMSVKGIGDRDLSHVG